MLQALVDWQLPNELAPIVISFDQPRSFLGNYDVPTDRTILEYPAGLPRGPLPGYRSKMALETQRLLALTWDEYFRARESCRHRRLGRRQCRFPCQSVPPNFRPQGYQLRNRLKSAGGIREFRMLRDSLIWVMMRTVFTADGDRLIRLGCCSNIRFDQVEFVIFHILEHVSGRHGACASNCYCLIRNFPSTL